MFFDLIRGGQILNNRILEAKEVFRVTFRYSLILALVFIAIKFKKDLDFFEVKNAYYFYIAQHNVNINQPEKTIGIDFKTLRDFGFKLNNQNENQIINQTKNINNNNNIVNTINKPKVAIKSIDIVNNKKFMANKYKVFLYFQNNFVLFFILYGVIFFAILVIFTVKGYFMNQDKFLRGAKIVSLKQLNKIVKKYNKKNRKKYER